MFHAGFPEPFGRLVIGQFKADCGLELFKFSGTNFDVEIISLVGDFEDFGPSKSVDAQTIAEDKNAGGTNAD